MLKEHDPTIYLPAVRAASRLAAVIASQIAVQTQATQRSFKTIEDDLSEYATDFVSGLIDETTKTFNKRLIKFRAKPPQLSREATIELADDWAGPVAGPTAIERYFGIPRSTLYRWQKVNEVVSINSRTTSKPVFPLKQFVDGRPLTGIAEIISIFGDQRAAWLWLVTQRSDFGGQTGLDLLLERKVDIVTSAARGTTSI
ncbi:hypothetical protein [Mesorhizobium argentiipisi]|uniref:Antitoxin Xre/MbcA/ParS-like middle domain-containing protein n=1 Tax=Mesorhizobium argentiipisi TaxID=3015175 RepID=A0ABU8KFH6_9HYPH